MKSGKVLGNYLAKTLVEANTPQGKLIGTIVGVSMNQGTCVVSGVWEPNPKMSQRMSVKFHEVHVVKTIKNELFYHENYRTPEE